MNEQQILSTYERIARVTGQMLAAAQAGDWDRLTVLERDCTTLFAPLLEHDRETPIAQSRSADYVRRKSELIRGILADDAQIRVLVEPQLDNLAALLGSTRQKQRLIRAYQADG